MSDPLQELGARLHRGMRETERAPLHRRLRRRAGAALAARPPVTAPGDDAASSGGSSRGRLGRAVVGALAGAALLGGGTVAVATLGADGADPAPVPDKLPPALRDGAVLPDRSGRAVFVADGLQDGVRWRLSAATCDYGARRAVGVFLTLPTGGGGARCDVAAQLPGADPAAIARRRVFTYYDAATSGTWVFGAVPAAARSVTVAGASDGSGAPGPTAVPARPVAALPGLRVFLTTLPGAQPAPVVRVLDGRGDELERCVDGRCPTPIPGAP